MQANPNQRQVMKAEPSRQILRKFAANHKLLIGCKVMFDSDDMKMQAM